MRATNWLENWARKFIVINRDDTHAFGFPSDGGTAAALAHGRRPCPYKKSLTTAGPAQSHAYPCMQNIQGLRAIIFSFFIFLMRWLDSRQCPQLPAAWSPGSSTLLTIGREAMKKSVTEKKENEKFRNNIWSRYKHRPTAELKQLITDEYLHLVDYWANRMAAATPGAVEADDLYQDGVIGLMGAIESYEPEKGIKFETYGGYRIRGSMIDGLRNRDWVPRLTRQKNKQLIEEIETIQGKLGYEPDEEEIRKRLKISRSQMDKRLREGRLRKKKSLQDTIFDADTGRPLERGSVLEYQRGPRPGGRLEGTDEMERLTKGLKLEEKLILVLYYREGLTMIEIGRAIGVTESRISQMHTLLLKRLRAGLKTNTKYLSPLLNRNGRGASKNRR